MMSIIRIVAVATLLGIGATWSYGAAAEPGTPAQKKACRPDVYRLCAAEIPNVNSIVRCLKGNVSRLSPDCRSVMEGSTG